MTHATVEELKSRTDSLLEKIADGTANSEFQEKYFPKAETESLMSGLALNCDFKNRRGVFLNAFPLPSHKQISFLYEFYLSCDSLRFIFTYKDMGSQQYELMGLQIEQIQKDNKMILNSKERLPF